MAWNLSVSDRGPPGQIKRLHCSTTFHWNNCYNIKKQRKCTGVHAREVTPPRWVSDSMYREDYRSAFSRVRDALDPQRHQLQPVQNSPSHISVRPNTRLRTKTNVSQIQQVSTSSSSSRAPFFPPSVSSEGLQMELFVHFDDMG